MDVREWKVGILKLHVPGVLVKHDLKCSYHVNDIVKRASTKLYMLRILNRFKLPANDLNVSTVLMFGPW